MLKGALLGQLLFESRLETILAFLGNVEPATDRHTNSAAVVFLHALGAVIDFLDIVETLTGLDSEERKLIPRRRNDLTELGSRDLVDLPVLTLLVVGRIQPKSTTPASFPGLVRVGQVENVADTSASDDIVVAQQMASGHVDVDGHVSLLSRQRS